MLAWPVRLGDVGFPAIGSLPLGTLSFWEFCANMHPEVQLCLLPGTAQDFGPNAGLGGRFCGIYPAPKFWCGEAWAFL